MNTDEIMQKVLEKLDAIDSRLQKDEEKLDYINWKTDTINQKVNDLRDDTKFLEKSIRKDIRKIYDGQDTIIEVLRQKDILPKAN